MQPGLPVIGVEIPALITRNSNNSYASGACMVGIQRRKDNFPLGLGKVKQEKNYQEEVSGI